MTPTFSFEFPVNADTRKIWVVFTHSHDGHVFFIGYCPFADFLVKPNLKLHPGWSEYMRTIKPSSVQVNASIYYSAREAMKAGLALYKSTGIPRNMYANPFQHHYRHCTVRCIETDQVFQTARAAADWIGVHRSQMSMHLARRSGYAAIKGYTFQKEAKE